MTSVIDAHHHLWDPAVRTYPWMVDELARPFTLEDLRRVTASAGVDRTVLVQTVSDLAETREFLATAAASQGLVAGVVGWVEPTGDVAGQVAELRDGPGGDLLVGVRHQVEDEADPDWFARPGVVDGARSAAGAGLVTDLLVRFDQLASATRLVDAVPDGRFVLDHGAKPPMGTEDHGVWEAGVRELARRPQVVGKLSGLFTLDHQELLPVAVAHLVDVFGPDRLVFGTDWPVSTLAHEYADVVARTRELLSGFSSSERDAVLAGNAVSTYQLQPL